MVYRHVSARPHLKYTVATFQQVTTTSLPSIGLTEAGGAATDQDEGKEDMAGSKRRREDGQRREEAMRPLDQVLPGIVCLPLQPAPPAEKGDQNEGLFIFERHPITSSPPPVSLRPSYHRVEEQMIGKSQQPPQEQVNDAPTSSIIPAHAPPELTADALSIKADSPTLSVGWAEQYLGGDTDDEELQAPENNINEVPRNQGSRRGSKRIIPPQLAEAKLREIFDDRDEGEDEHRVDHHP